MARAGHHRQILLKYLYRNHGTYHGDYAWDYRGYGDYSLQGIQGLQGLRGIQGNQGDYGDYRHVADDGDHAQS